MTTIKELTAGQGSVEVEGTLKEMGEPRTFNKFGRELRVTNAVLEDDSGSVKLSLWNDDVDRFKEGDKVKIINGYVNEFQGEPQLTSGKFGSIEKVDGSASSEAESSEEKTEEKEESVPEEKPESSEGSNEEVKEEVY
jgi:replication factor A1